MYVNELLAKLKLDVLPDDSLLEGIQQDSRKVMPGDVFLALKGARHDGGLFIDDALGRGAGLIFTDSVVGHPDYRVIYIENLVGNLPLILNIFFHYPLEQLDCVGVTGTNGKTTVAKLSTALFKHMGHKVISIGTIENEVAGEIFPSSLTTPDLVDLMKMVAQGVKHGCKKLVMEVSSHGLSQGRTKGMLFTRALFTNLTQDHLDYHLTLENYFQEKKKLFTQHLSPEGFAIINYDSEYGRRIVSESNINAWFYSLDAKASFDVGGVRNGVRMLSRQSDLTGNRVQVLFEGKEYNFKSKLIGLPHIENLLAVIALGFSLRLTADDIAMALENVQVPGRNQVTEFASSTYAVVDYAHTPDALERTLQSLRPLTAGKLICVFGCGGNRDRGKRSIMGNIAEACADVVIITSDNPRLEEPTVIIEDILTNIKDSPKVTVMEDRSAAIAYALGIAQGGDCVLIAGKGHEDYQIIGDKIIAFSDNDEIQKFINHKVSISKLVDDKSGVSRGT